MFNIEEIENNLSSIEYMLRLNTDISMEDFGAGNYNTSYYADLISCDGSTIENESYEYIGKLKFNLNHIKKAREQGIDFEDYIDDNRPSGFEGIFDPKRFSLTQAVLDKLQNPLINEDILIIHELKIFQTYRGLGIADKLIKLIFHHFGNSCGLIMIDLKPAQFEHRRIMSETENIKMKYEVFTNDEELAYFKLANHFIKMGFKHAIGYVFFIETAMMDVKPLDFDLRRL